MTITNWILDLFPIACMAIALTSERAWLRKIVALVLFAYFLLTCTFGFDVIGRDVAAQAQKNGEFSAGFTLGLTRLNDALLKGRGLLILLAVCFLVLAIFPVRQRDADK